MGLGKMEYDEIEVVGTPLEEAIIQDFPKHPYKARKWPWTPTMYGKVANWDAYYRHEHLWSAQLSPVVIPSA